MNRRGRLRWANFSGDPAWELGLKDRFHIWASIEAPTLAAVQDELQYDYAPHCNTGPGRGRALLQYPYSIGSFLIMSDFHILYYYNLRFMGLWPWHPILLIHRLIRHAGSETIWLIKFWGWKKIILNWFFSLRASSPELHIGAKGLDGISFSCYPWDIILQGRDIPKVI